MPASTTTAPKPTPPCASSKLRQRKSTNQTTALTVNSALAGTSGLVKTGAANLLLTAANPFTGPTAVNVGTLTLTGSLASTSVQVASGATLTDATGGFAPATALTNAGTLAVNAAETIASLTNNAGTVSGTGTLTVTGPTLFNGGTLAAPLTVNGTGGGTFANALLAGTFNGTAALDGATVSGTLSGTTTNTGNTLVSGSIGGGSLNETGGVLNLTGTSTNTPVAIGALATLVDANGGPPAPPRSPMPASSPSTPPTPSRPIYPTAAHSPAPPRSPLLPPL